MLKSFIIPKPSSLPGNEYVLYCDNPVYISEFGSNKIGTIYIYTTNTKGIRPDNIYCLEDGVSLINGYSKDIYIKDIVEYDGQYGIVFKFDPNLWDESNSDLLILFHGSFYENINLDTVAIYITDKASTFGNEYNIYDGSFEGNYLCNKGIGFQRGINYFYTTIHIETVSGDQWTSTIPLYISGTIGEKSIQEWSITEDNPDPEYYSTLGIVGDGYVEVRIPIDRSGQEYGDSLESNDEEYYFTSSPHGCDGSDPGSTNQYYELNLSISSEDDYIGDITGRVPSILGMTDVIAGIHDTVG